ncbi:FtsB family cell division protein [Zavarzinia sp. CC-PAN008]|uniref:FtsB family cell division protein n=1 Tax=Zavarzinia sp. CC-PAN008 TaxID=3243332 RepID=UPI003F743EF1
MAVLRELRRRSRRAIFPVVCTCITAYFSYHAVQGEYGILSWIKVTDEIRDLKTELAGLKAEHDELEHRALLMRPESIDPDLLDERARDTLGYIASDEVVISPRP